MEQLAIMEMQPSFMGWFDPDTKKAARQKLKDAIAHYRLNYRQEPTLVLVNSAMLAELDGPHVVRIEGRRHVQPNTFYVGQEP